MFLKGGKNMSIKLSAAAVNTLDDNESFRSAIGDPFKPKSETVLLSHIDEAIEQADSNMCMDSEIMEEALIAELGL